MNVTTGHASSREIQPSRFIRLIMLCAVFLLVHIFDTSHCPAVLSISMHLSMPLSPLACGTVTTLSTTATCRCCLSRCSFDLAARNTLPPPWRTTYDHGTKGMIIAIAELTGTGPAAERFCSANCVHPTWLSLPPLLLPLASQLLPVPARPSACCMPHPLQ